jgi:hypothetical protein
MRAGIANADAAGEQVAIGAVPLPEVALLAFRALVDDEVARQLDRRRWWSRVTLPERRLAAGRGAVPLTRPQEA